MKNLKSDTKVIITGNTSNHLFDIGQEVFFSSVTQDNQSAILNYTEESDSDYWFVNLIDFCTVEDFMRTQMLDKAQEIINSQEPNNARSCGVITKRIKDLENALTEIIGICEDSGYFVDTNGIITTANKALYL